MKFLLTFAAVVAVASSASIVQGPKVMLQGPSATLTADTGSIQKVDDVPIDWKWVSDSNMLKKEVEQVIVKWAPDSNVVLKKDVEPIMWRMTTDLKPESQYIWMPDWDISTNVKPQYLVL